MLKDINCGDINKQQIGNLVTVAGWVNRRREHGNLIFIDLRDREGLVQIVFNPELASNVHAIAESLRNEWVIQVKGRVTERPDGTINTDISSGEVEVYAEELVILNESKTPPFYVNEDGDVDETLRLKYRYVDLRRENMKDALITRHNIVNFIRTFLNDKEFLEIETPILIKSTPEGARDHVVPSRLYPGSFYALPQSPQQLKQLLMVAGLERYFQIARCFRDEDSRADRQPEFTQLDLEMSFVEQEDILKLTEDLFTGLLKELFPEKFFMEPFPRLSYDVAMAEYGVDRPDLRFEMKLKDVSEHLADTEFQVFNNVLGAGGIIKGLGARGCADFTRSKVDDLTEFVKSRGASGLISIGISGADESLSDLDMSHVRSNIQRFLTLDHVRRLTDKLNVVDGDLILLVAGDSKTTNASLGALRNLLGNELKLIAPNVMAFAFVTDFPLFDWNEQDEKWDASHHAFCMPKDGYEQYLKNDPGKVIAQSYDLICNGIEMASGSIRVHNRELQEDIFAVLGYSAEEVSERFSQLLDAFEYGAPPHGGIAPGIDRLAMVLLGRDTIRDVIAFPKTQSQMDPMFGSPSEIEQSQLDELKIQLIVED